MLESGQFGGRREKEPCEPLDVIEQLGHHLRPLVPRLHLFQLEFLQNTSGESVQRYREDLGGANQRSLGWRGKANEP